MVEGSWQVEGGTDVGATITIHMLDGTIGGMGSPTIGMGGIGALVPTISTMDGMSQANSHTCYMYVYIGGADGYVSLMLGITLLVTLYSRNLVFIL